MSNISETTPDFEPYYVIMNAFGDNGERGEIYAFVRLTPELYSKYVRYEGQLKIMIELFGAEAPKSIEWDEDSALVVKGTDDLKKYDFFQELSENGIVFTKNIPNCWNPLIDGYLLFSTLSRWVNIDSEYVASFEFCISIGDRVGSIGFKLPVLILPSTIFEGKTDE